MFLALKSFAMPQRGGALLFRRPARKLVRLIAPTRVHHCSTTTGVPIATRR